MGRTPPAATDAGWGWGLHGRRGVGVVARRDGHWRTTQVDMKTSRRGPGGEGASGGRGPGARGDRNEDGRTATLATEGQEMGGGSSLDPAHEPVVVHGSTSTAAIELECLEHSYAER